MEVREIKSEGENANHGLDIDNIWRYRSFESHTHAGQILSIRKFLRDFIFAKHSL